MPIPHTVSSGRFVLSDRVLDAADGDHIAQPFDQTLSSRQPPPELPCASVIDPEMRPVPGGIV